MILDQGQHSKKEKTKQLITWIIYQENDIRPRTTSKEKEEKNVN
jgi:hypothetical protein